MKISRLSGLLQFIMGFVLGIALLVGGAATAAYFFLANLASAPPKPLFAAEKKELAVKEEAATKTRQAEEKSPGVAVEPSPVLPSDSYRAKVIWNQGLSLRAEPSTDSARLGTVPYQAEILVLGTNNESTWQRIRLLASGEEGWIKGGNIEKLIRTMLN